MTINSTYQLPTKNVQTRECFAMGGWNIDIHERVF